MAVVRDLRVLLRFQGFRRLLGVRLLSQGADGVYQVALATYVVFSPEKQTSAASIASAMAVLLLPYSLVGPFAGVLLDRWQRRQVFLYGNLLRAALACVTALLMLSPAPDWLFYTSALCVTAVNRFVLAGLSAALPRVVDRDRLVVANSLSPTAGTLAATVGAGLAFAVRLVVADSDAAVVLVGAGLYLCAALASLRIAPGILGPDQELVRPYVGTALMRHRARPRRRRAPSRGAPTAGGCLGSDGDDPDALLLRRLDGHGAHALPLRVGVRLGRRARAPWTGRGRLGSRLLRRCRGDALGDRAAGAGPLDRRLQPAPPRSWYPRCASCSPPHPHWAPPSCWA